MEKLVAADIGFSEASLASQVSVIFSSFFNDNFCMEQIEGTGYALLVLFLIFYLFH